MNINKSLSEWRKTKSLSLASEICEALVEMLEDDTSVVKHQQTKDRGVEAAFENEKHSFLLVKLDDYNNFKRLSVLENEDSNR